MKKFFAILAAATLVLGFCTTAMAGYAVVTSITSEAISGDVTSCDKFGAVTYTFKAGTIIRDGDWMYFDLPRGVNICRSFDFVVMGDSDGDNNPATFAAVPTPNVGGNGVWVSTTASADGATDSYGPWKLTDLGQDSANAATGLTVVAGGAAKGLFLRVTGASGTQRVNLRFYDNENANIGTLANADGNTTLKVADDAEFELTLFDGEAWDGKITNKNIYGDIWCYKDTDDINDAGYATFGDDGADDVLQHATRGNLWDNFICAMTTQTYFTNGGGDQVNVSFDSGGQSGDDFLTFSGQREIAHIVGQAAISLSSCAKEETCGYVRLVDEQGDVCSYYYNSDTEWGYCPGYLGDKFVLNKSDLFGPSALTEYYVVLRVTSSTGNGTYFRTGAAAIEGLFPANQGDVCSLTYGTGASDFAAGVAWTPSTRTGVDFSGTWPTGAGCGAVAETSQVTTLTSGRFSGVSLMNRLMVEIPTLVFNPALLSNGDSATVELDLYQSPCGKVFSGSRCVANYVTNCQAAIPTSTLLFPYAVALDSASAGGWWFGLSFCNPSEETGIATITCYEDDGDVSSFATAAIAAGGMATYGAGDLLSNLTLVTGNTGPGTLGNARCHIVVQCQFGFAGGFGMMGNNMDSTGYAAYSIGGDTAGNWFED